jgi:hypothetical protein
MNCCNEIGNSNRAGNTHGMIWVAVFWAARLFLCTEGADKPSPVDVFEKSMSSGAVLDLTFLGRSVNAEAAMA